MEFFEQGQKLLSDFAVTCDFLMQGNSPAILSHILWTGNDVKEPRKCM